MVSPITLEALVVAITQHMLRIQFLISGITSMTAMRVKSKRADPTTKNSWLALPPTICSTD